MKNKIIRLILVLLVLTPLLTAGAPATIDDYRPHWIGETYEGMRTGMLYNFWHSFWPFYSYGKEQPPNEQNADIYGWYNHTNFGLANWEREVCMIDLSSEVRNVRNVVYNYETESERVYTTTVTVSATRELNFDGNYTYEASWYLVPYSSDAYYRIYFLQENDKFYIKGKDGDEIENWERVAENKYASGYYANYLQPFYEKAVLEYKYSSSGSVNEFLATIANKTVE